MPGGSASNSRRSSSTPARRAGECLRAPAKSGLHRSGGYEGLKGPVGSSAVVAQGGGDAGGSGETQDGQGEITQGGHDAGIAAGPNLGQVFAVGDVADPVQTILDCPVAA